jgi:7-cyano-7-deazaguanine synthase
VRQGYACHALSFRYGQRHAIELERAAAIAHALGAVRHVVLDIDLRQFGGSALTADIPVPKLRSPEAIGQGIPSTYVPARNTVFLSLALAWAETLAGADIFIGVNALDYSGYPDCRPEFIDAFVALARVATKAGAEGASFRVHTPLITRSKTDIIRLGLSLGLDYGLTHSCYDPRADGGPCGRCDSCRLRAAGFAGAGAVDPIAHRATS